MSRFSSFRQFYPYYLSEHSNHISRRLHFIGSCCVLVCVALALWNGQGRWLWLALLCVMALPGSGTFSSRRTGRPPSAIPSIHLPATG